jgi:hypothetical protein
MESKNLIVLLTVCTGLFYGCKSRPDTNSGKIPILDIAQVIESNPSIEDPVKVKNISFIPLETNEEVLLKNPKLLSFENNSIWILSNQAVFRFDEKGRFVHKIDHRGQGPQEYRSLDDIAVDYENARIFCLDDDYYNPRLIQYGFDGDYIGSFKLTGNSRIEYIEENLWTASDPANIPSHYIINRYDISTGEKTDSLMKPDYNPEQVGPGIILTDFYLSGGKINVKYNYNDTAFYIENGRLHPHLIYRLGEYVMPIEVSTALYQDSKKYVIDFRHKETASLAFVSYTRNQNSLNVSGTYEEIIKRVEEYEKHSIRFHEVWDKNKGKLIYRKVTNPEKKKENPEGIIFTDGRLTLCIDPEMADDQHVYTLLEAYQYLEYMKKDPGFISDIKEEDNQILCVIKI